MDRLPDQLRPDLRLVFVGTAASTRSADLGHYYAHPGNRFWPTLFEVGITPRRYAPREFASLLRLGIGFTDLCKSGAGMDHQISVRSDDIAVFRTKMLTYRPRTIAFTSKKAASLFYGRPTQAIGFGRQPPMDGFPRVFVLASPSGAASGHWTLQPWRELAEWMGADQPHHDSAGPDVAEDRRRLDAFKSNGQAVPFDDVKGWIASWDSMDELPRPSPRKII